MSNVPLHADIHRRIEKFDFDTAVNAWLLQKTQYECMHHAHYQNPYHVRYNLLPAFFVDYLTILMTSICIMYLVTLRELHLTYHNRQ